MYRRILPLLAIIWALGAGVAWAAGVGNENYNFVNPPANLRATNSPPGSGQRALSFARGVLPSARIVTTDGQAMLVLPRNAVAPAAGQSGVLIQIVPRRTYPALPGGHRLDGNVYGLQASYVPSHRSITALTGPAIVSLVYPTVAAGVFGLRGGSWSALCPWKSARRTSTSAGCTVRGTLPTAVAIIKGSGVGPPGLGSYLILGLSVITLVALVGILSYVIWTNFVRPRPVRR